GGRGRFRLARGALPLELRELRFRRRDLVRELRLGGPARLENLRDAAVDVLEGIGEIAALDLGEPHARDARVEAELSLPRLRELGARLLEAGVERVGFPAQLGERLVDRRERLAAA